jgi:hypothetical protein
MEVDNRHANNHPKNTKGADRKMSGAKVVEIPVDRLIEAVEENWDRIRGEAAELLKDYDVPPEHMERLISDLKHRVRSELLERGLPDEDWLVEALSKLYIRLVCEIMRSVRPWEP